MTPVLRLLASSIAKDFRGRLGLAVLRLVMIAALAGSASSVAPALIGTAIDKVMGAPGPPVAQHGLSGWLASWLSGLGTSGVIAAAMIGTLGSVALTMYSMRLASALGARVTSALRTAMLRSALRSSPREREKLASATKAPAAKQARGADVIRVAVASTAPGVAEFLVTVLANLPQIIFGLAVLIFDLASSGAGLAAVGGVALFVASRLVSRNATKRVSAAYSSMQASDAALFGRLGETLEHGEELRLLGARDQAVHEFSDVAETCATARASHAAALSGSSQIKSAFTALSPLLIVVALTLAHGSGQSTPPGVVAKLVLLVPLLMARLDGLDGLRIGFAERTPMFESSARVLSLPPAPPRREGARTLDPKSLEGVVRFDDVTFSHDAGAPPQLDHVSFDVPAGAVVGICGQSGSGKSTLLRLLLRGRDPSSGGITIDDVDVRDIEPDSLPSLFAVLGQRASLLERSLRENLALGLTKAPTDAELEDALQVAGLGGVFGKGSSRTLDYSFRSADSNLSGGEMRRLALARMILRPAPVLLLDEPEAALPSADAEALLRRIKVAARGRTCIVVTHAPHLLESTFNVFLQNGRVVARGTHAELSASCEGYRGLLADAVRGSAATG